MPPNLAGRTSGFEPKQLLEQPECHLHAEVQKLSPLSTMDYSCEFGFKAFCWAFGGSQ